MHRITRSQFYLDKINQFLESNDSKIYLEYVDEEKRNIEEEKELNKEFRK